MKARVDFEVDRTYVVMAIADWARDEHAEFPDQRRAIKAMTQREITRAVREALWAYGKQGHPDDHSELLLREAAQRIVRLIV